MCPDVFRFSLVTVSDVFRMWFFEDELVRQEGQTPPGGFVSYLVHHISQSVDVLSDILQQHKQTKFCF